MKSRRSRNYCGYTIAREGSRYAVYDGDGLLATFPGEPEAKAFVDRLYARTEPEGAA